MRKINKTVALVSCVKSKSDRPKPAKELYTSTLFRKSSKYARMVGDQWFILSAKYGLLSPEEKISPYEKTLNNMRVADRRKWAKGVLKQLKNIVHPGDEIVILAGVKYREHLIQPLQNMGCTISIPMEGLSFGLQLSWLKEHVGDEE